MKWFKNIFDIVMSINDIKSRIALVFNYKKIKSESEINKTEKVSVHIGIDSILVLGTILFIIYTDFN